MYLLRVGVDRAVPDQIQISDLRLLLLVGRNVTSFAYST
jgi:hypothetical protein